MLKLVEVLKFFYYRILKSDLGVLINFSTRGNIKFIEEVTSVLNGWNKNESNTNNIAVDHK